MATEVIIPKVDMVMESGTFVEWLKKEGERVCKGDPLFVIMTDKAAIEVESPADGILSSLKAKVDDIIPVASVIAYILAPGEAPPPSAAPQEEAVSIIPAEAPILVEPEQAAAVVETAGAGKVRASPLARSLARDLGVDLKQIAGRGPRGRIHKADVLAFQKPRQPAEVLSQTAAGVASKETTQPVVPKHADLEGQIPLPDARRTKVVPLVGPRKIIAERMAYSSFTAPHITLTLRVDMTEAIRLRERVLGPIQKQTGQRVSFTAILARAVASVLPRHPYLNASLSDGNIILWEDIHLGIATSVEDNLIVPVIRESQSLSLGQTVAALADLIERARNRRLTPAEMMGSTFTISNLGMYGIESFTAIINPPESVILAVGKMVDTPIRNGDSVEFRPMIQLTASADHRIVDGVAVARFLDELKSTLENPYLLI
jgi:pyruvate dehydrogenase E2 component (dihydrolipoamide acetyltransferase)